MNIYQKPSHPRVASSLATRRLDIRSHSLSLYKFNHHRIESSRILSAIDSVSPSTTTTNNSFINRDFNFMDHHPIRDFFSTEIDQHSLNDDTTPRESRRLVKYVAGLKDERRKIEAFKRELPLCFDLLNDAVERFEVELRRGKGGVECNLSEVGGLNIENDVEDMKNWMSSVQLWNSHCNDPHDLKSGTAKESKLSLRNPVVVEALELNLNNQCNENVVLNNGSMMLTDELKLHKRVQKRCWSPQQVCRKQRRCWSKELHRSFVDALHQLGGSEVATPKQIRDIMRVEGLTNDEVKSHLQKYRLRICKTSAHTPHSPSSNVPTSTQDDLRFKLKTKSHSISPQGPLDISTSSVKYSGSNNTTVIDEEDEEEETEGQSWRDHNRVIYRPAMPTF